MGGVIYIPQCSKPKVLDIGHTGEQTLGSFSQHRNDIINRPVKRENLKDFHENGDLSGTLNETILQNNFKTTAARRYHKDKWISKSKSLALRGLNTDLVIIQKKYTISCNSGTGYVTSFNIIFTCTA